MNNLKIRKFNESILERAKLITNGNGFFKTYDLNNGNIIKVVKTPEECFDGTNALFLYSTYNEFIDELYEKLTKSVDITTPSIVLPNCIYLDNNSPRAYSVPKQRNMIDLNKYLLHNNNLETISSVFIDMSNEVKKANKEELNLPDLGNSSNILINPKNKEIKFIDYDGMQIGKYPSFNSSRLVNNDIAPFTRNPRYCNLREGLVNNNFDKLSLYALFIFFTTRTLLTDFGPEDYYPKDGKLYLKKDALLGYTKTIGINDTALEDEIIKIYEDKNLNYPNTSIKKLLKTHTLEGVKFIKK